MRATAPHLNATHAEARKFCESAMRSCFRSVKVEDNHSSALGFDLFLDDNEVTFDTFRGKMFILVNGREYHYPQPTLGVSALVVNIINIIKERECV